MKLFKNDPVTPLLGSGNETVEFYTRRDLLGESGDITRLWEQPEVKRIIKKQQPDGAFAKGDDLSKRLVETWRHMRFLVQAYGMDREHGAVRKAAEFLFSCQTDEGDIRGIIGNQYAPYYTGAIVYLLINAGYADDERIKRALEWLLSMRQYDGGWVIGSPGMVKRTWAEQLSLTSGWTERPERDFDFSLPFSAAGTGMVIRAFAAHPEWLRRPETLKAAELLKSKLFKKDNWSYMGTPDHWLRFNFPYWWNDLVSALDMISHVGIPKEDAGLAAALKWFAERQQPDGLWKGSYSKTHKEKGGAGEAQLRLWVTLSVCRIFKRYYGETG